MSFLCEDQSRQNLGGQIAPMRSRAWVRSLGAFPTDKCLFKPDAQADKKSGVAPISRHWCSSGGLWPQGPVDRAIADLDVVVKADPKNPPLIHERGAMKAKMGDRRRAEALTCGPAAPERPR